MFNIPSFMGFDTAGFGTPIDPDAAAFFARVTAAGGTLSATEQTAVNTLVVDLKAYGIWNSMKAVYPMVGASAAACAQNLKSSSFTGTFTSGWTFASTGVTPNGTSAYMDSSLTPSISLSANNISLSYYSRTNSAYSSSTSIGADSSSPNEYCRLIIRRSGDVSYVLIGNTTVGLSQYAVTDSRGLFIANAPNSTTRKLYRNNSILTPSSQNPLGVNGLSTRTIYIGALHDTTAVEYDNKECSFASIGDGLTDTQASNFYTAVQTFNQTLNRQVGAQIVSDADAQAYIDRVYTAGGTLTNTEANAVNQLTIDMKAAGIWTAMKAVYPMVGSSAAACAQNLKSSSFTGTFTSGWTFSSTGATPNGSSAYMDTNLNGFSNLTQNSTHLSIYCRTNQYPYSGALAQVGLGSSNSSYIELFDLETNGGTGNNNTFGTYQYDFTTGFLRTSNTDTRGFLIGNRPLSNSLQLWRNGSKIASNSSTTAQNIPSFNFYLSALNNGGTANNFSSFENAFASIGDGLTDTQAADFYTCVQTFNTTLSRQV